MHSVHAAKEVSIQKLRYASPFHERFHFEKRSITDSLKKENIKSHDNLISRKLSKIHTDLAQSSNPRGNKVTAEENGHNNHPITA